MCVCECCRYEEGMAMHTYPRKTKESERDRDREGVSE